MAETPPSRPNKVGLKCPSVREKFLHRHLISTRRRSLIIHVMHSCYSFVPTFFIPNFQLLNARLAADGRSQRAHSVHLFI